MKVCLIMAGDEEGGLEKHLVELSNGIVELIDELIVIAHEKYRKRFLPNILFIPLDLSRSRHNPLLLFKLALILHKQAPDIIHAHANKAVDILNSIKYFVPGTRIGTLHSKKKKVAMYLGMHTVIGVSKGVVSELVHPDKRVVYNGIAYCNTERYSRIELVNKFSLTPNSPITLSVGRLVPVKAFDNLINAWQPEFGHLLIVGEGPEKDRLVQLIQKLGLDRYITLTGFCSNVQEMMSVVDLLVVPSHREGFSYVVAEALLSRLPVLSTRVPVANEILPEQFLVDIDNVKELAGALHRVLTNLSETQQQQTMLFDWAANALTVDNMAKNTVEIYTELLKKNKL